MILNFLKKTKSSTDDNKNNDLIKIIALLIHAAKIDENYSEKEKNIIKKAINELGSNSHGIGCLVKVHLEDGTVLVQHAYAGDGFLGSSDPAIYFGLGNQTIEYLEVTWSTGHTQTIEDVQINSVLDIEEELPPPVKDFSAYVLAVMTLMLILLLWPLLQRNS